MGKKAEDMTPEEIEARNERMRELRVMALEKRQANAASKKEAVDAIKQAKKDELESKRQLIVAKVKANQEALSEHQRPLEDLPTPPPRSAPIAIPMERAPDLATWQSLELIKAQLKEKYKTKYAAKYAAPPQEQDHVKNCAKEVLNTKVQEEVRRLAYQDM